ncbi:DUF6056 family protein [Bilophila wadsworthia]|uniref:DUF6056 family protein n=1 Tax=Bilophila wadsworthia TaxID=35833 RepID=UPI00307C6296
MRIPSARLALPVLVWAVLYATHAFLGYYHDDYAYAGLTYFYTVEGPYSERLTLLNYVNYLYQHYIGWGGRIVAFGIAIPFMHAGPSVFWLVQSLLVTGILCFGASIAARFTAREDFPQTLLFLLASYMSMKITLVRDGLYWGAASVLYVWPMFFLLWAIFLIMREPLRKKDIALAAVLFFIASASSEPFSLYAFAFVGMRLLVDVVEKKKRLLPNLLWLSTSLAGFLFCFLAPGNLKRAMSAPGQSVPPLAELLKGIPDAFVWAKIAFPLFYSPLLLFLTLLALCFYALRIGMAKEKIYWQLFPFVAACCATTCLFLLPVARSPRVSMPLILTLPIIAAPALNALLKKLPGKLLPALCLLGIIGYGLSSYIPIWEGYRANYDTIVANDATLSAYKPGDMSVVLKKLPDEQYANAMPYTPGTDYIAFFMKQYYDIPMDIPLIFK